jgi:hypothetical protein
MSNGLEKGSNEKNDLLITKTRQKRVRRTLVHTRQVDGLRKTKGVAIWYCAALPRTRHMREDPPPLLPPPLALSPFVLSLTESRVSLLYRFEGPILSLSLSLYIYISEEIHPHPSPLHTTPPFRIDRLRHRRGSQAMANIDMAAILADLDRADARLPKTKIVCTLGPASRSVPHDRKAAPRRHERRPRVPILSVVVPVLTTDSFVLLRFLCSQPFARALLHRDNARAEHTVHLVRRLSPASAYLGPEVVSGLNDGSGEHFVRVDVGSSSTPGAT